MVFGCECFKENQTWKPFIAVFHNNMHYNLCFCHILKVFIPCYCHLEASSVSKNNFYIILYHSYVKKYFKTAKLYRKKNFLRMISNTSNDPVALTIPCTQIVLTNLKLYYSVQLLHEQLSLKKETLTCIMYFFFFFLL